MWRLLLKLIEPLLSHIAAEVVRQTGMTVPERSEEGLEKRIVDLEKEMKTLVGMVDKLRRCRRTPEPGPALSEEIDFGGKR